ncbi:hypothetical protein IE077_001574 [Cardiosporidium cionae]|uniref:Uncharacterized protein n=1 Tax=Cardiosporidium cionae TaxID=476202 RepID=A0ABQ7JCW2_9APIC|nr:hypothetical protein IE077_001574 [Cardiosporidium cionae]|eukprot:KAF8821794.1 hypothetical protein IE077_001574 [Cardiosporidium cionae]
MLREEGNFSSWTNMFLQCCNGLPINDALLLELIGILANMDIAEVTWENTDDKLLTSLVLRLLSPASACDAVLFEIIRLTGLISLIHAVTNLAGMSNIVPCLKRILAERCSNAKIFLDEAAAADNSVAEKVRRFKFFHHNETWHKMTTKDSEEIAIQKRQFKQRFKCSAEHQ